MQRALTALLMVAALSLSAQGAAWKMLKAPLMTQWASDVNPENVLGEYPRPQLVRNEWRNLNGIWQFSSLSSIEASLPESMTQEILVPFCVESAISGIKKYYANFGYRRTFTVPEGWLAKGKRVLLHFEAVDWQCVVTVNGKQAGEHKGGYDPFTFDITTLVNGTGENTLEVKVYDPTNNGCYARGKQTLSPGGIMYTSVSGIWQPVWMESVNDAYIDDLTIVPDVDKSQVKVSVKAGGDASLATDFSVEVMHEKKVVATGKAKVGEDMTLTITNPDLWSPDHPFLYDLNITMNDSRGKQDKVKSYFGMRKISMKKDDEGFIRMQLNNKYLFQMGPLDQGFWPDGIYTAPTDEALANDIVMMKRYGFNMVRKHIKVEPRRWYYWCDKLGLMVWQDMPSTNTYGGNIPLDSVQFNNELKAMVNTHYNVPSIIMWVLYNEGQGPQTSEGTKNSTFIVRGLDKTRLINEGSGWSNYGYADIKDTHPYPSPIPPTSTTQATACGEYGGITYAVDGHKWSNSQVNYTAAPTPEAMDSIYDTYSNILAIGRAEQGLSAAVYTQITDVEAELNGLMTYDRIPKSDVASIYRSNRLAIEGTGVKPDYILPTANVEKQTWKYTTAAPDSKTWYLSEFDDSSWSSGLAGFKGDGPGGATLGTTWKTSDIWIRKTVTLNLTEEEASQLAMRLFYDEDTEVYLNGVKIYSVTGYVTDYKTIAFSEQAIAALNRKGENVFAIHTHQTTGGQYIDMGLILAKPLERAPKDRAINVNLNYSNSREVQIGVGYSTNLDATEPEEVKEFTTFQFADEALNGSNVAFNKETLVNPTDLSYDITALTKDLDLSQPVKLFFFVRTTSGAEGTGTINSCSFTDYTVNNTVPFTFDKVEILNDGRTTMLTAIVSNDKMNPARNVHMDGTSLKWEAPAACSSELTGYIVYKDGKKLTTLGNDAGAFDVSDDTNAGYTVAAQYKKGLSVQSDVFHVTTVAPGTGDNLVRYFNLSGFRIPDVFSKAMEQATIEFWMKPDTVHADFQQVGPGWGSFVISPTSSNQIRAGWTNASAGRVTSAVQAVKPKQWNHIAVTVDGRRLTLYINGKQAGILNSTIKSGLPQMLNFEFGGEGHLLKGYFDDVRIWKTARTAEQIVTDMDVPVLNPASEPDLLAYYMMDEIEVDGEKKLRDGAGLHHAPYLDEGTSTADTDNSILSGKTFSADFSLLIRSYRQGAEVVPEVTLLGCARWKWNAPDAGVTNLTALKPSFIFPKTGSFDIVLTAYNATGDSLVVTRQAFINAAEKPKADFTVSAEKLPAGQTFSFINKSENTDAVYQWTLTGANEPAVTGTNATATYARTGTYDVVLTATNAAGTATAKHQVTVTSNGPNVNFEVYPSIVLVDTKAYLRDSTTGSPVTQYWDVYNDSHHTIVNGSSSSFTPKYTGLYTVAHTAENADGRNTVTKKDALLVCSDYSLTGFRFQGQGETITFDNPFAENYKKMTIDWWMKTDKSEVATLMSSSNGQFSATTKADGTLTVKMGTRTVNSTKGFIIPGEWHHYTIAYNSARIYFYRDGVASGNGTVLMTSPAWSDFILGGETPLHATIDELSLWTERRTGPTIKAEVNNPINDIDAAKEGGLFAYYKFNDGTKTLADASGQNHTATVKATALPTELFVPSTGVFALDLGTDVQTAEDVSEQYLTNYKMKFIHTDNFVSDVQGDRFCQLESETETSGWKGDIMAQADDLGVFVDKKYGYTFNAATSWNGFPDEMTDKQVWQTVTLPAGSYRFAINCDEQANTGRCYLVATEGNTLSSNANLDEALASATLEKGSILFTLLDETTLSLGVLYNLPGFSQSVIKSFVLYKENFEILEADGLTDGIRKTVADNGRQTRVRTANGGLVIDGNGPLRVYNVSGQLLVSRSINGATKVNLPKGIYIVNGQKVAVK